MISATRPQSIGTHEPEGDSADLPALALPIYHRLVAGRVHLGCTLKCAETGGGSHDTALDGVSRDPDHVYVALRSRQHLEHADRI